MIGKPKIHIIVIKSMDKLRSFREKHQNLFFIEFRCDKTDPCDNGSNDRKDKHRIFDCIDCGCLLLNNHIEKKGNQKEEDVF